MHSLKLIFVFILVITLSQSTVIENRIHSLSGPAGQIPTIDCTDQYLTSVRYYELNICSGTTIYSLIPGLFKIERF